MKVLFVSRGYPTSKYPMNGVFEYDQAKAIAKLGHKVIFASVDMRSIRRKRKWGFEKIERDNILIYGVNWPFGRVPKSILSFFTTLGLKLLYKKIEKDSEIPDIMHAHFTNFGYSATKLKEKINIPLVITEHSSGMMKTQIDNKLKEEAISTYPNADKIIAVSPALSNVIKSNFKTDATYIPNIVDTSIFKYEKKNRASEFTFITVGNLIYRKRVDLTVKAFIKAFQNNNNVKLIVIGEGEERDKIEAIIKEAKLENRVLMKGRMDRNAISNYMKNSDCFVLPSRAETFGVVYIEAMATGLPVIATKCGGPEGFINEKNGLMIDIDNLDELAEAMQFMYQEYKHYNSEEISRYAYKQFSPEEVASKIVEVYMDIIN